MDYKEDARDLHAFKELRFFLSHAVPLEVRCGVARLELPLVADFLVGDDTITVSSGQADTEGESKGVDAIVRRIVSEQELVATAQIFSDGQPMHAVPMSSHTPSRYDPVTHAIVWDDTLCFPVRYRDLDRNSQLVVTLSVTKNRVVGLASMRFFDANGSLAMGLQKRPFKFTTKRAFAWNPAAPPSGREPGESGIWCCGGANGGGDHQSDCSANGHNDDGVAKEDWGFRLERMREKYRLGAMDRADWLDPISLSRVDQLVATLSNPAELRKHRAYQTESEARLRALPSIVLEMPCFAYPVIHEERPYSGVPGGGGGGTGGAGGNGSGGGATNAAPGSAGSASVMGGIGAGVFPDGTTAAGVTGGGGGGGVHDYYGGNLRVAKEGGTVGTPSAGGGVGAGAEEEGNGGSGGGGGGNGSRGGGGDESDDAEMMAGAGGRAWGSSDVMAGAGVEAFCLVSDYEMEEDNPVEHKYRKLAHDQLRGLVDPELKPNRDERQRIDAIVAARQDHLRMEDRDLIWKFRYCLTDNKRALTKLLLSVDWGVDSEVAQVDGLLAEWARRAPIDAPDALKLLGRERTFQAEVVRRFAVDALRRASDEELLAFLLQLVQALRYQASGDNNTATDDAGATGAVADATSRGVAGDAGGGGGLGSEAGGGGVSPLAQFLIDRACKSLELANFFYWYLRVDLEDATHGHVFRGVQAAFLRAMLQNPESARVMDILRAQDDYVQAVAMAHKEACELHGKKPAKDQRLRELLKAPHLRRVPRRAQGEGEAGNSGGGGGSVPMPLDPTVQITGLEPSSAFLFKSALYPCVIEFTVKLGSSSAHGVSSKSGGGGGGGDGAEVVKPLTSPGIGVSGDDGAASASRSAAPMERRVEARTAGGNMESGESAADQVSLAEMGNDRKEESANGDSGGVGGRVQAGAASWLGQIKAKESSYKVIIKSGDDLRQDQLIMQMISLMDSLLKRVNLDLRLKPYGILATGPKHGLVQFVSGSQPISSVLSSYNGSILEYLRHHNQDPTAPNGVRPSAVQTFVKSTAGYCVITYLLGIGDRHLDNIMLLPAGNLFHIDFGYIFGREPKPMAPPFRFTREMADAMGGVNSEDYKLFKTYCCQAYNWLRKSANLILNLLSLMSDAGISELSTDPVAVLAKVEERFRLDLTDEMAEHFFLSLIGQSLQAFAPRVIEVFHQIAVARR